jgi:EAL domain-containing protein (putative c-di-GMP-specific phosphodiesterase class I)
LRWHHPHLGLISPQKFMATAEESGLIVPLQRWIIEAVCAQLKRWQENPNFNSEIGVSINFPSLQLLQTSFVKCLKFNLDKYQIPPHLITWEISEYLIGENPQKASIILPLLKQLGIQLQIDNFGRVASMYGHVKPNLLYQEFERVKIDRHLVSLIERDQLAWDVFKKIILELKKQGFSMTITGIENLSQLKKVNEIAGDYGQGNLLSQPLNSSEATNLMSSNQVMFDKSNLN